MLDTGQIAPDFELRDIAGQLVSSRDLRAKADTLFALFKISCPVCQLTFPFLERLHRGVAHDKLQVVGISQNNPADTQEFNEEFGVTFPTLIDPAKSGYQVSNAFGINNVPSLFLTDSAGAIVWQSSGFVKKDVEDLARRYGFQIFRKDENVPAWKAG
jgi:peroxiredoxin